MSRNMKRRIYVIAALALVNITIMKYKEPKSDKKADAWAMAKESGSVRDSLLTLPAR